MAKLVSYPHDPPRVHFPFRNVAAALRGDVRAVGPGIRGRGCGYVAACRRPAGFAVYAGQLHRVRECIELVERGNGLWVCARGARPFGCHRGGIGRLFAKHRAARPCLVGEVRLRLVAVAGVERELDGNTYYPRLVCRDSHGVYAACLGVGAHSTVSGPASEGSDGPVSWLRLRPPRHARPLSGMRGGAHSREGEGMRSRLQRTPALGRHCRPAECPWENRGRFTASR
ncbi:MAG: hypothetical protein JWP03_1873 [Phycisphaerales bacterium]|nr:hypothetical protein [Phycisphaerales bacterium]